jgi:hypothetical protein
MSEKRAIVMLLFLIYEVKSQNSKVKKMQVLEVDID